MIIRQKLACCLPPCALAEDASRELLRFDSLSGEAPAKCPVHASADAQALAGSERIPTKKSMTREGEKEKR